MSLNTVRKSAPLKKMKEIGEDSQKMGQPDQWTPILLGECAQSYLTIKVGTDSTSKWTILLKSKLKAHQRMVTDLEKRMDFAEAEEERLSSNTIDMVLKMEKISSETAKLREILKSTLERVKHLEKAQEEANLVQTARLCEMQRLVITMAHARDEKNADPRKTCDFKGCEKPAFFNFEKGIQYECCGITHARTILVDPTCSKKEGQRRKREREDQTMGDLDPNGQSQSQKARSEGDDEQESKQVLMLEGVEMFKGDEY